MQLHNTSRRKLILEHPVELSFVLRQRYDRFGSLTLTSLLGFNKENSPNRQSHYFELSHFEKPEPKYLESFLSLARDFLKTFLIPIKTEGDRYSIR